MSVDVCRILIQNKKIWNTSNKEKTRKNHWTVRHAKCCCFFNVWLFITVDTLHSHNFKSYNVYGYNQIPPWCVILNDEEIWFVTPEVIDFSWNCVYDINIYALDLNVGCNYWYCFCIVVVISEIQWISSGVYI